MWENLFWFTHFFHPHRSDRVANIEKSRDLADLQAVQKLFEKMDKGDDGNSSPVSVGMAGQSGPLRNKG